MMLLTDARKQELALRLEFATDFPLYAKRCLKIRTKAGDVVPFRLNRSQLYLHERLEQQIKDKKRVRALVLKGRQVGISTYIGARLYWKTTHGFGKRAFVLTHLDAASDNLFGMTKRFHEHCPPVVKPMTRASNAKELSFGELDSGYKVATAGSAEVGRSETIQFFHGSETAYWPNALKHAAGIRQAIANVDETEVIFESTGIGNVFHSEWRAAERGDSDFEPIFIPWFWHEEYTGQLPPDWPCPPAFAEYRATYELTDGQTYWAWQKNGIVDRQGRRLGGHVCKRLDEKDLMALAGQIQVMVRQINPAKVVIDTTGLGAGLYDRLRELLGDVVEGVNFGAKAFNPLHFANRRAEIWDGMRQWFLDPADVQIPDSDELHGDLTAPTAPGTLTGGTRFNSSGQLLLEPKDHMRQRLSFSPDLADAAALTFAVDLSMIVQSEWPTPAKQLGPGGWLAG